MAKSEAERGEDEDDRGDELWDGLNESVEDRVSGEVVVHAWVSDGCVRMYDNLPMFLLGI